MLPLLFVPTVDTAATRRLKLRGVSGSLALTEEDMAGWLEYFLKRGGEGGGGGGGREQKWIEVQRFLRQFIC